MRNEEDDICPISDGGGSIGTSHVSRHSEFVPRDSNFALWHQ